MEVDTVRAFFHEEIANSILNISISRRGGADFVFFFDRQGNAGWGASSDRGTEEKNWKALWSTQAPGKMKFVLWRFIHDCLHTGHQLQRWHISANGLCVFCSQHERVEHLFLLCPFARAVWAEVKQVFPLKLLRKDLTHSKQWVFDFLRRENNTAAMVLAVPAGIFGRLARTS
jgi:hypothetical protein